MVTDIPTAEVPEPDHVQVGIPPVVLPLAAAHGLIPTPDGSAYVVMVHLSNAAGGVIIGALSGDQACELGRNLMALGREAMVRKPLVVPSSPLVVPGGPQ